MSDRKNRGDIGSWTICTEGIGSDSVVYAVGVGTNIAFDLGMTERVGVTVHARGPTPKSIAWLSKQKLPERFHIHEFGLADFDGEAEFYPPANSDHVSHSLLGAAGGAREFNQGSHADAANPHADIAT